MLSQEPLNADSLLEVIRRRYAWARGWEESFGPTLPTELADLASELRDCGITTVQKLTELVERWYDDELKESQHGYLVGTGKLAAQTPDDRFFGSIDEPDDEDPAWYHRMEHYYMPLAQVRGILKKEFPEFRPWEHDEAEGPSH